MIVLISYLDLELINLRQANFKEYYSQIYNGWNYVFVQ